MFEIFNAVYAAQPTPAYTVQDSAQAMIAAAQPDSYAARTLLANRVKNAALILHDVGSKEERKNGWKTSRPARSTSCLSTTCCSPALTPSA
jgi:hypothetical protein